MRSERKAKFRGVTSSRVPGLSGRLVDFIGHSSGHPWVRAVDNGEIFVCEEGQVLPLRHSERQLDLPLPVAK